MTLPFNLQTYGEMLNEATNCGYSFIGFDRCHKTEAKSSIQSSILLRHDVDGDLSAAVRMAALEAELGVSSTYFLMRRSPCYNLMSRANQKYAESLIKYGHQIGLHYDQGYDAERDIPKVDTEAAIEREANWLEDLLKTPVHAVSFHQPSSGLLQKGIACGERVNTYDKSLLSNFKYFSDSNRNFPLWKNSDQEVVSCSKSIANC